VDEWINPSKNPNERTSTLDLMTEYFLRKNIIALCVLFTALPSFFLLYIFTNDFLDEVDTDRNNEIQILEVITWVVWFTVTKSIFVFIVVMVVVKGLLDGFDVTLSYLKPFTKPFYDNKKQYEVDRAAAHQTFSNNQKNNGSLKFDFFHQIWRKVRKVQLKEKQYK
jgi:hypothetical protein